MNASSPLRVVVLTMDTPGAARTLAPLLGDGRFSVELAVLARRVAGRRAPALLLHLLRVSGARYVLWQLRRKLPALARGVLLRLGLRSADGAADLRAALRRAGIPAREVESLHAPGAFDAVRAARPDLIVCAIFPERLRPEEIALPPLGAWNVHGSLLPAYRGVTPVLHALADGAAVHGATVHRIEERLDTGPVLVRESFALDDVRDYRTAWERTMVASAAALARALDLLAEGRAACEPQPEEGASTCSWPSRETLRRVRARGIRLN